MFFQLVHTFKNSSCLSKKEDLIFKIVYNFLTMPKKFKYFSRFFYMFQISTIVYHMQKIFGISKLFSFFRKKMFKMFLQFKKIKNIKELFSFFKNCSDYQAFAIVSGWYSGGSLQYWFATCDFVQYLDPTLQSLFLPLAALPLLIFFFLFFIFLKLNIFFLNS